MTPLHTNYILPQLPYSYNALEPYIDANTMELHHTKHHQGYINKLNKAVATLNITNPSLEDLCKNIDNYPLSVRNNGGGHYNHTHFWTILSPQPQKKPTGPLAIALANTFESIENFKSQFNQQATTHFGSGWAWLIINSTGKLAITTTPNQDNPLMPTITKQGIPILGIDLWEHAYYLKYQNRRPDYINAIWHIIDWKTIEQNYDKALAQL